jgi:hypothetical protein
MIIWIILFATQQEPASLEEPQGRTAGPALQAGSESKSRARFPVLLPTYQDSRESTVKSRRLAAALPHLPPVTWLFAP